MQKSEKLKIAGIQFEAFKESSLSVSKACELIRLASSRGATIISLAQLFANRWFPSSIGKSGFDLSEDETGIIITTLKEVAAEEGVVLIVPIFEKDISSNTDGDYYSTAFVIGTKGEIIGKYRKTHIPQLPFWEEKSYFKSGNLGLPVFDTPFCKVGVLLCRDIFYPEAFKVLADKGAEVIFTPTASAYYHSRFKWERAIQSSAHINGVFVFRVNRVGKEKKQTFYGRSFCTHPDGEFIVGPTGSSEGIVLADINLNEISSVRSDWAFSKDTNNDNYK